MKSFTLKLAAAAVAAACILPGTASASGGGSGPNVQYAVQGKIGEVITNPYKIAPLTAVIRNGGYQLKDAAVRIVPKHGGAEIKYNVSDVQLRTHAGIPVFGLYPDYNNTVEVSYTLVDGTKETRVENEVYRIYAPGIHTETNGTAAQHHAMFETEVKKVAPEFKDRLYFINNFLPSGGNVARTTWNNPMGGALEWVYYPQNAVIDTAGDVRWYMFVSPIYDPENIYKSGIMMGFHQADDGFLTFGYGQRYAKYDLMGREVFNRRLPAGYADFSHAMDPAQNGHYFLRVSSADYRRPDGKRVHTVRDVILEVDQNGCAVDDFRLFDILDPYRDNVIKAMDQGAVCLNVDASKSGKDVFYLSVFDNGDARGMEQPALPEMKYSRAVIYRIDQKKMTIEQVWEYGKERGFEWYSPITSVTEYQADKNSVFVYSATASLNMKQFKSVSPNPVINEFKWGSTEPSVEIVLKSTMGYRALPISLDKAFSR